MHFDWFDSAHHKYAQCKHFDKTQCRQKGFVPILIVILVAVLGIGGYFVYKNSQTKPSAPTAQPATYSTPQPSPSPTNETANPGSIGANWKTYTNTKFGFSLKVPPNYFTGECDDGNVVLISSTEQGVGCQKGVSGLIVSITTGNTTKNQTDSLHRDFLVTEKAIDVDGINGTLYEGKLNTSPAPLPPHVISSIFAKANNTYRFDYYDYNNGSESTLYSQILSTFKFTK